MGPYHKCMAYQTPTPLTIPAAPPSMNHKLNNNAIKKLEEVGEERGKQKTKINIGSSMYAAVFGRFCHMCVGQRAKPKGENARDIHTCILQGICGSYRICEMHLFASLGSFTEQD